MSIRKLDPAALDAWVDGLIRKQKVFGVQSHADRYDFAPLERAADLRLDYDVAVTAPKKYFQPSCEALLKFQGADAVSLLDRQPFVVFGIHPYDAAAILQMDVVFSEGQYDTHYMTRRNAATLVLCDVLNPSPNVFAGHMGTAVLRQGGDVLLTKVGGAWLVEARTDKGEALVADAKGAPADAEDLRRREAIWAKNEKGLRKHELKVKPENLPALLAESYDHPVWEERAARCFSCGSCTNVCPTCYCFDVRDEMAWDLKTGQRVRVWDGCQLADFAKVAGGHNFRKKRAERFRHRYYRKGKYLWDKHKQIACVGCGRCIGACVSKIANPVEIYNRLAEGK